MRKTAFIVAVLFAVAMIPQAFADATPNGATVYAKCQGCHGKDGSKNFPDVAKKSEAELAKVVEDGMDAKPIKMPAYKGKLTADEISQVVKYIKSLKK